MSFRDVLRGAGQLQVVLPFTAEDWQVFQQTMGAAVAHFPALKPVADGLYSLVATAVLAPAVSTVIDVDAFAGFDWGVGPEVPMDVSPQRKIKKEAVSDAKVDDEVEIIKGKGKKKEKVPDYSLMEDFDARYHEMMLIPVRTLCYLLSVASNPYFVV